MQPSTKIVIMYSAFWVATLLLSLLAFSLNDFVVGIAFLIISIGCMGFTVWIRSNPYWVDPDPEWGES